MGHHLLTLASQPLSRHWIISYDCSAEQEMEDLAGAIVWRSAQGARHLSLSFEQNKAAFDPPRTDSHAVRANDEEFSTKILWVAAKAPAQFITTNDNSSW